MMAVTGSASLASDRTVLATEPANSLAWWFLGTLAVLRNPPGAPRTPAVIELTIPCGGSPPLHVHDNLDDCFLMLEGEVLVRCGESRLRAVAGSYVVLPAGVEHTFLVTSSTPAKMLLIHEGDDFLNFIEAVGTPTNDLSVPPPGSHNIDRERLIVEAAHHDVRIIGPSLDQAAARILVQSDGTSSEARAQKRGES